VKIPPFAQIRKAVVNVAGLIATFTVPALPLFHGDARIEAGAVVVVAAAVAHYCTRNAPASKD
jgi:hypothetical protein